MGWGVPSEHSIPAMASRRVLKMLSFACVERDEGRTGAATHRASRANLKPDVQFPADATLIVRNHKAGNNPWAETAVEGPAGPLIKCLQRRGVLTWRANVHRTRGHDAPEPPEGQPLRSPPPPRLLPHLPTLHRSSLLRAALTLKQISERRQKKSLHVVHVCYF